MKLQTIGIEAHARGKMYEIRADGKIATLLLTFHALERMQRWKLSDGK